MKCRHCGATLSLPLVDLGSAPPSNSYLTEEMLRVPEKWYPLRVLICTECWLVQTEDYANYAELFSADYAYFSSFSITWLQHAERYVVAMVERFNLGADSHVVEVASNDGYLLQYVKMRGIPCLGIEPTASTAKVARAKGIEVYEEFFGVVQARRLVGMGKTADLIVANNVLAHVPNINDFVAGFALLLKPDGVATFEFTHLVKLVQGNLFDTIYHEHFSYLSLTVVKRIFEASGLTVFDVEELPTQGGSLRIYAQRRDSGRQQRTPRVAELLERERIARVDGIDFYSGFQVRANRVKNDFVTFLIEVGRESKKVAAYGAAAKGNTLLNYAGVRPDLMHFVSDRNPAKQGRYMPGSRIPIVDEDRLKAERPDYVVILPWNLRQELMPQLDYVREWGGRFVTAVPSLTVQ